MFIYSFIFPFLIGSSLITDQSLDLLITSTVVDIIDYSSFDCILFNSITSISILFILLYLLIVFILFNWFNINKLNSSSIIGSYSTFYLPIFIDLLLVTSINCISLFIICIELISFNSIYSLSYSLLLSTNQVVLFIYLLVLFIIIQ